MTGYTDFLVVSGKVVLLLAVLGRSWVTLEVTKPRGSWVTEPGRGRKREVLYVHTYFTIYYSH